MTSVHAIMVVVIRLWAASSIFTALASLPSAALFAFESSGFPDYYSITYFGGLGFWVAVGAIAWFVAPWLARRVYSKDSNS
ncbi:MAG: hypothetical protein ACX939_04675 [Hyphococcus sp.]